MTVYWIYNLPNWQIAVGMLLAFVGAAEAGFFATRPLVRRLLGGSGRHNDIVSYFLASVGVFYGLALGLIAVATWQDFSDVDGQVSKEAADLARLYRDLDGYPSALRLSLEDDLRTYTRSVIDEDWPLHRKGQSNPRGEARLDALENRIMAIEPTRETERIAHREVLDGLNEVVEARTLREGSVGSGLPMALWLVVLSGAVLNIGLNYLFSVDNVGLHALLIGVFAAFLALLIFLTAAMDNPFRGEFSVSPDAYQAVIDQVMSPRG